MMDTLFSQLSVDTLILTPNQRLSATLIKQYNHEQINQGLQSWPLPPIRPLASWIQELWDNDSARTMNSQEIVLSPDQELILWEELLAKRPESENLLKLSDLAKQAKSAWSTLKHWRCDYQHAAFVLSENGRYFQAWAQQFADLCEQRKWIDSASLCDHLINKIRAGEITLPRQLLLYNFTEFTPQQQELMKACREQGSDIQIIEQKLEQTQALHLGLADEENEIQTIARWAKSIWDQQPQARIGCIFSQLEEKRDLILSIFKDVFDQAEAYNISAGRTLSAYPVLQQALQLLNLSAKNINFAKLSALLASPFIGDAESEMLKRLQLDAYLRKRNFSSGHWQSLLEDTQAPSCPHFKARLQDYLRLRQNQPTLQTMSEWNHFFAHLLEVLGWPGEQSLNSHEYQVVQAWLKLLLETSSLDHFLPPLNYHQALHYLNVLAAKTYFQPESPQAPIQILGQLEGAGLPFDYLWVSGLDDTAWPPAPSPNPLIPNELQKTLAMPNASAERQLEYSVRMMAQFKQAAPTVIFSYALHGESEEKQPSPLIAGLEKISVEELKLAKINPRLKTIFNTRNLESCQDEQAPPIQPQEKLRGGVSIFEKQAACPFKAFAEIRLGAKALDETQSGLRPDKRGTVIHKALELFWSEVKTQAELKALNPQPLQDLVQKCLDQALDQTPTFLDTDSHYHKLVRQRLEKTLMTWLELEKARPPFKIAALEEEQVIRIHNYEINIRVDRVDELAQGEKLIIDYKTRKSSELQAWFGLRPDEPQLPLYCINSTDSIAGIAFGQLHSHKTEIKGLSRQSLDIEGIKPLTEKSRADAANWEQQVLEWRLNLTQLFQDFEQGKAEVDPKNRNETCRYCHLQTLCRIHEDQAHSYEQ